MTRFPDPFRSFLIGARPEWDRRRLDACLRPDSAVQGYHWALPTSLATACAAVVDALHGGFAMPTVGFAADQVGGLADCLACGGTGAVLMLTGSDRYEPQDCPVCAPIQRAG